MVSRKLFLLSALCATLFAQESSAMNLLQPYDTLIRPPFKMKQGESGYHVDFFAEHGFHASGYNECGDFVNVLGAWSCNANPKQPCDNEDALKMLDGFDSSSAIGELAADLRRDGANDDGVRGHFLVSGALDFDSFAFSGRYNFQHNWFITAYLPFYSMRLKNVCWRELTQNLTAGDISVKQKLTNNFFENVRTLGSGLELGGWKRTGLGDLALILEWFEDFYQPKPLLRNVRVNWRIGLTLPTGLRQDENKIFALPFGNDGAVGLLFGVGLDLDLGRYLQLGGDIELLHRFGNIRCRRIKTQREQSTFLLLQKAEVYKDWGLDQRFNLFLQFHNMGGLIFKCGYRYYKHGEDILSMRSENYSELVANTAENLDEKTMHQAVLKLGYDFEKHLDEDAPVKPSFYLYSRIPFAGRCVAMSPTFGLVLAFDF